MHADHPEMLPSHWNRFLLLAEADLRKLSHALKLLSETEKQLRMSKNQTTWLTVALLQLSSADSSCLDERDSKCCSRNVEKGEWLSSVTALK